MNFFLAPGVGAADAVELCGGEEGVFEVSEEEETFDGADADVFVAENDAHV